MLRLGVLTEPEGENRVAIVPKSVKKLTKAGFEVIIQSGAGAAASYLDSEYENYGWNRKNVNKNVAEGPSA